ncbi:MAG: hypothetical protein ACM3NS_11490 [Deltaproteobacteria bacterium]
MEPPVVRRGSCQVLVAFEVGQAIDLDRAEQLAAGGTRRPLRPSRRAPQQFGTRAAPLRIQRDAAGAPAVAGLVPTGVEVSLYEFGAASVGISFPLAGPLDALPDLSDELYGHPALLADARARIAGLLDSLAPAVTRPKLSEIVEDYVLFRIDALATPLAPDELVREHGAVIARTLRAERGPVSDQEIADALSARLSAGPSDLVVVDWNAALVYDPDPAETCAVLEFANVQLLEMRFLDAQLDSALERAYDTLSRAGRGAAVLRSYAPVLGRVAELQADAAVLFERVTNALKLVGDQYLSRLYRLVSARFHLSDWDASIVRKLQTIDGIYQKLADRATARRLEVLEWIVILLIGISILLPFLPGFRGH